MESSDACTSPQTLITSKMNESRAKSVRFVCLSSVFHRIDLNWMAAAPVNEMKAFYSVQNKHIIKFSYFLGRFYRNFMQDCKMIHISFGQFLYAINTGVPLMLLLHLIYCMWKVSVYQILNNFFFCSLNKTKNYDLTSLAWHFACNSVKFALGVLCSSPPICVQQIAFRMLCECEKKK